MMNHRSSVTNRTWRRHGRVLPVLLLLSFLLHLPHLRAQGPDENPDTRVENLLATMSVEERVGQLFLITFVGNDTGPDGDIARLITQDHVGGVVLLASNSNFVNNADTPRQVAELTNALQALALGQGAQIPLFVAVDHEGDGYPFTRITGGTTPLPSAMAIGATWDPANARAVGQITGLELAAMGVNLLLGPSVDVLRNPRPSGQGDMGTRTFGGDPWWVGRMGRAYIEGVHQGSGGRVATVAKHFPGHGGSDRLPDEEVATVDKSLQELKEVELAPFIAVTAGSPGEDAVTDALMSSHIRYRGFQGEVRRFTAPISFDAEGMGAILSLDELAPWRATGLMVSDSLGVPAVRKYFDPTLGSFPHRRIAKEAFLAGNDLLLLSQFDLHNDWATQVENIHDTIAFFREEYRANPAFAARVDEAVARILRLKMRLYPDFTPEAVQVHPEAANQVCGLGGQVTQHIANQALTLLYPDANAVPPPPRRGERILILTDARQVRECFAPHCRPFAPLSQTAVEEAILRAYGPQGTAQIDGADITSLPFGRLKKYLRGEPVDVDVEELLASADWIILAQQDLNPVKGPNSDTVKLFLNDSRSTLYDARLVVFAFNAPYYLDTTEISKLSLYLGAYSKVEPFVEAAVRALFGELTPVGAPPVDVAGINYDLQRQLAPDPDQTIPLALLEPSDGGPLLPPVQVRLRAGPLLDGNGHPVADGVTVAFYAEYTDGSRTLLRRSETTEGNAEVQFTLPAAGQVRFRAESGKATNSRTVVLTIQSPPTATPSPTPTEPPTPTPPPVRTTAPPSPTPEATVLPAGTDRPARAAALLLALSATTVTALVGLVLLGQERRKHKVLVVRWLALVTIGGMGGYLVYLLLTR